MHARQDRSYSPSTGSPTTVGPSPKIFREALQIYKKKINTNNNFLKSSNATEKRILGVELASPEKIRKWAERILPTGKIVGAVLNANTIHHKTLKPIKGGLFCERIFGPTKDFRCACGKSITKQTDRFNTTANLKIEILQESNSRFPSLEGSASQGHLLVPPKGGAPLGFRRVPKELSNSPWPRYGASVNKALFCKICEVEYTSSLLRRYQLGYITLAFPVTHLWYTKGFSNPISLLLDIHKYDLDFIIYCNKITSIEKSVELTDISVGKDPIELLDLITKSKKKKINRKKYSDSGYMVSSIISTVESASINPQSRRRAGGAPKGFRRGDLLVPKGRPSGSEGFRRGDLLVPKGSEGTLQLSNSPTLQLSNSPTLQLSNSPGVGGYRADSLWRKEGSRRAGPVPTEGSEGFRRGDLLVPKGRPSGSEGFRRGDLLVPKGSEGTLQLSNSPTLQLSNSPTLRGPRRRGNLPGEFLRNQKVAPSGAPTSPKGYVVPKKGRPSGAPLHRSSRPYGAFRFAYNIYAIADDHLWDNREDWNILKSYITIAPSIVDALIPFYSQRISLSPLKNAQLSSLNSLQVIYEYTIRTNNQNHSSNYEEPWSPQRGDLLVPKELSGDLLVVHRGASASSSSGVTFRPSTTRITDSSFGVGAGILNSFFTSLTTTELTAMDKQLSQLLRESRMNILLYKTKQLSKDDFSYGARRSPAEGFRRNVDGAPWSRTIVPNVYHLPRKLSLQRSPFGGRQKVTPSGTPKGYPVRIPQKHSEARLAVPQRGPQHAQKGSKGTWGLQLSKGHQSLLSMAKMTYWRPCEEIRYSRIDSWMEKHHEILRRSKTIRKFAYAKILPEFMVLKTMPVLPPELRPIRKGNDGDILTSDLNRLYQRVLFRNERLNNITLPFSEYTTGLRSPVVGHQKVAPLGASTHRASFRRGPPEDGSSDLRLKSPESQTPPEGVTRPESWRVPSEPEGRPFGTLRGHPVRHAPSPTFGAGVVSPSRPQNPNNIRATESLAPIFGYEKHFTQRLLQEAIDNLIDNGRSAGTTEVDAKGRILKSLSEVLKGKQGRFRQYLLGKRVDYSGRSVIVVGPKLKIHQCGLPREMAIELYLPFIIQYLIQMKYTRTVVGAKSLIADQPVLIATILDEIVQGHPIVLNRAPTLHRLGFQAFQPILVDGRAILLHPMACTAFNADFDGDQMAVHIPITIEARAEAWRLMLARNNLLSPATGEPILLPSQDMILGCYYLTTLKKMPPSVNKKVYPPRVLKGRPSGPEEVTGRHQLIGLSRGVTKWTRSYYTSSHTVLNDYLLGKIHVHTLIWLKTKKIVYTEASKKPYEIRISYYGKIEEISKNCIYHSNQNNNNNINSIESVDSKYIRTTAGRILFNSILTHAYTITADGSENKNHL